MLSIASLRSQQFESVSTSSSLYPTWTPVPSQRSCQLTAQTEVRVRRQKEEEEEEERGRWGGKTKVVRRKCHWLNDSNNLKQWPRSYFKRGVVVCVSTEDRVFVSSIGIVCVSTTHLAAVNLT
eukprot:408403-Rhodomonas_salina.1